MSLPIPSKWDSLLNPPTSYGVQNSQSNFDGVFNADDQKNGLVFMVDGKEQANRAYESLKSYARIFGTTYNMQPLENPDILNIRNATPISTYANNKKFPEVRGRYLSHSSQFYAKEIERLEQHYSHWRQVRGDGNCFYRAIGFAYLEMLTLTQPTHCLLDLMRL